jgi:hypothetical protein
VSFDREQLEVKKKELVEKATHIHAVQKKLGITVDETMKLSDEVYNLQWEVSERMKTKNGPVRQIPRSFS